MERDTEASEMPANLTTTIDIAADSAASGIASSLRCHVGAVRTENQDRVGRAVSNLGELIVVADGVGGGAGGAKAATIAVEEYESLRPAKGEEPTKSLQRATRAVNKRIEAARQANPAFRAMASTVAVVLIQDRTAFIGHLGDSRVYLARTGSMRLLTRDHSVVRRMVDEGVITEDEASTHPSGHILTQSLGQEGVELEVSSVSLQENDVLLLCSDGLWAYVPEAALAREITKPELDTPAAANKLLELSLAAGAPDNISLALLSIGPRSTAQILATLPMKKSRSIGHRQIAVGVVTSC